MPLTTARRLAIDNVLDTFVPAAVERHSPLRALVLVTHSFRAGVSREEWLHGNLPVFPYDTRTERFHSWRVNYSYPREVSVELLLHTTSSRWLTPEARPISRRTGCWCRPAFSR